MTVNYILKEKQSSKMAKYLYVLLFVVIYFTLFEFVLPYNTVLPKPSLLAESFISLQSHYNFWANILFTLSALYLSIVVAYLLITLLAGPIIKLRIDAESFFNSVRVFRFFPLIGFISIFVFWFPLSAYSELVFAFVLAFMFFAKKLIDEIPNLRNEYIDPIIPLGAKNEIIYKDIIWKSAEPALIKSLTSLNFLLWTLLLLFEYVKGNSGIGYLYRMSLDFRDLSGLFILSAILSVVIFLGDVIIHSVEKKLIRWEP